MPDREKVMKGLECCSVGEWTSTQRNCDECPYYPAGYTGCAKKILIKDALALLREQKKTKVVFRQYDGSVESECGNCGLYLDKTYSVCPKCGKELDWNA